jgi:hypothetical protein
MYSSASAAIRLGASSASVASVQVNFRASVEEKALWRDAAHEARMPLGEWMRRMLTAAARAPRANPVSPVADAPVTASDVGALSEEGGVNESSSDDLGQQMSPLRSPENDRSGRSSASTSPPADSARPRSRQRTTMCEHRIPATAFCAVCDG